MPDAPGPGAAGAAPGDPDGAAGAIAAGSPATVVAGPRGAALPAAERRPAARLASRLEPGVLDEARRRGRAVEGLAWLGRPPEAHATLRYRAVRLAARLLLLGCFGFRIRVTGREHLPASGGYLVVAAAHRGWMDPFVILHALPAAPRGWFLGSAPSTFTAPWKEWLIRKIGGLLPVWRGGVGIDQHVAGARAVLAAGGVFIQMPEGTVNGPPGIVGPFRPGAGIIAIRTGAPIVPFAIAGTEELYLGRRMAGAILPPTSVPALVGEGWDGTTPEPGSRAELELARRVSDAIAARLAPVVAALQPTTVDPPVHRRLLRRRLTWLLLRNGRLERGPAGAARDARAADEG